MLCWIKLWKGFWFLRLGWRALYGIMILRVSYILGCDVCVCLAVSSKRRRGGGGGAWPQEPWVKHPCRRQQHPTWPNMTNIPDSRPLKPHLQPCNNQCHRGPTYLNPTKSAHIPRSFMQILNTSPRIFHILRQIVPLAMQAEALRETKLHSSIAIPRV